MNVPFFVAYGVICCFFALRKKFKTPLGLTANMTVMTYTPILLLWRAVNQESSLAAYGLVSVSVIWIGCCIVKIRLVECE